MGSPKRPRRATLAFATVFLAFAAPAAAATLSDTTVPTTIPATTVSATTVPSSTSTTAAPAPAVLVAQGVPCNAPSSGAACTVDPRQLEVSFPTTANVPVAFEVAWVHEASRPAKAPLPVDAGTGSILQLTDATPCAGKVTPSATMSTACFAWPAGMAYLAGTTAWVLNGAYQVSACATSTTTTPCSPLPNTAPAQLAIAVPPAAPTLIHSKVAGAGRVTISWSHAAAPEPDLIGYEVTRGGIPVYACNTDGYGRACPSPLAYTDAAPAGNLTYNVLALRYGANGSASALVSTPGSSVHVVVSGAGAGLGQVQLGPASIYLPPVPVVENLGRTSIGPTSGGSNSGQANNPSSSSGGNLTYPTVPGSGSDAAAVGEPDDRDRPQEPQPRLPRRPRSGPPRPRPRHAHLVHPGRDAPLHGSPI